MVVACATTTDRLVVMSYNSIELSQGVINLINDSGDQPIALENDDRIRCIDLNFADNEPSSRFCQTREEFDTNLERGQDLIHSINANP